MDSVIEQLLTLLTDAGLHCVKAFPQKRLPRLQAPMIAVGISEHVRVPAAIGGFVGTDVRGAAFFGLRETSSVKLDLYFPYLQGGEGCPAYIDRVLAALTKGIAGLRMERLHVSPLSYDPDADCFRCTVTAMLRTVVCRQSTL